MAEGSRQLASFLVAGALGFLVDVAVLYAALALGAGWILGRLLSFLAAASFTWQGRSSRCSLMSREISWSSSTTSTLCAMLPSHPQ